MAILVWVKRLSVLSIGVGGVGDVLSDVLNSVCGVMVISCWNTIFTMMYHVSSTLPAGNWILYDNIRNRKEANKTRRNTQEIHCRHAGSEKRANKTRRNTVFNQNNSVYCLLNVLITSINSRISSHRYMYMLM